MILYPIKEQLKDARNRYKTINKMLKGNISYWQREVLNAEMGRLGERIYKLKKYTGCRKAEVSLK